MILTTHAQHHLLSVAMCIWAETTKEVPLKTVWFYTQIIARDVTWQYDHKPAHNQQMVLPLR